MRCLELLQPLRVSFFLSLLLFFFSYASNVQIDLKEIVYIDKKQILLKDVADVKSDNENLKNYIENIILGYTSRKTVIRRKDVLNALKENFVDTSKVKINGSQVIVVVKKSTLDENYIKQKVRQFLKERYPDIFIENIQLRRLKLQVVGKPQVIIKEKGRTSSYIYLTVLLPDVGRQISVSVKYAKLIKAVVARYPLPKGHIISAKDVVLKQVKVKRKKDYIEDIKDAVGKKLKRSVKKDQPISYFDLEKQFLVRKNSNVKVIYKKGSFKIELLGRALENGELGQIIKVKNISSGKVIQCKVVGINQVEFLSGGF